MFGGKLKKMQSKCQLPFNVSNQHTLSNIQGTWATALRKWKKKIQLKKNSAHQQITNIGHDFTNKSQYMVQEDYQDSLQVNETLEIITFCSQ